MTVDSIHVPVVSITADPGTVLYRNQKVTFTTSVSNAGNAPTYQWLVNGTPRTGATAATFSGSSFNDGDSVTCVVTGTGECGYATINSVTLHVLATTGVAQTANTNSNIALIPNPNNGSFVITGTLAAAANEEVTLEVTDVLGQIVYHSKVMANNGSINERIQLNNTIANGMYLLNLHSGTEHTAFHFVVKQ